MKSPPGNAQSLSRRRFLQVSSSALASSAFVAAAQDKDDDFRFRYTEIFMHPVPRGIPILPTAAETTAEIVRAREYLEGLRQTN
jgi:hypothetical protein